MMKTGTRLVVKKLAVWLMALILTCNYCVNIALAAEGIGDEYEGPKAASVEVELNTQALVDGAVWQIQSGNQPHDGRLWIGSTEMGGASLSAFVTLADDYAGAFAEISAESVSFDGANAFNSGYTSALREEAPGLWQNAASKIVSVVVQNDSDVPLDFSVRALGDALTLNVDSARVVDEAGNDVTGETVVLDGTDAPEGTGPAKEDETPSEDENAAPDEDSTEDPGQAENTPAENPDGPEKAEDDADNEETEENPEMGPDEALDGSPDEEPENTEDPVEDEETAEEAADDEEEAVFEAEGDVSQEAGRGGAYAVFYETAESGDAFDIAEDVPKETETQQVSGAQDETTDEKETDGTEDSEAVVNLVETNGNTIVAKQIMPARALAIQAVSIAAPLAAGNGITIKGDIFAQDGTGLNSIFRWYTEKNGQYAPVRGAFKNIWTVQPQKIEDDAIQLSYPSNKNNGTFTFYLGEIPPSGCQPIETALASVTIKGNQVVGGLQILNAALIKQDDGTYSISHEKNDAYRQYVLTQSEDGKNMFLGDNPLYCFDHNLGWPDLNVRYIKADVGEVSEQVERALYFGHPGDQLSGIDPETAQRDTQLVIWALRDSWELGVLEAISQAKAIWRIATSVTPEIQSTDKSPASVQVAGITDQGTASWTSGVSGYEAKLNVTGHYDFYSLSVPKGVLVYNAGSELLSSKDYGEYSTTVLGIREREITLRAVNPAAGKVSVTASRSWEEKPSQVTFYKPVSALMTHPVSQNTESAKEYQRLVGYDVDAGSSEASVSFQMTDSAAARSLKLHLDHLVQTPYDTAYDAMVRDTQFKFALVKDNATVATGTSKGANAEVIWDGGANTVDLDVGSYTLFGYDVSDPYVRVVHEYQRTEKDGNHNVTPGFAGTQSVSDAELEAAASQLGKPFMGVKVNVTDADMDVFNGGTLYYHAESKLPMGELTVRKDFYNHSYRHADDEFDFEIVKLPNKESSFSQGTHYATLTVRAGSGSNTISLPYGDYAIREVDMPSYYSFRNFASGAGVTYYPADNYAAFSMPRDADGEDVWKVTVTAENRVDRDTHYDDGEEENGGESGGGGGGGSGGGTPGNRLNDNLVNIPDEAIPLSDKPETLVEIPDEDVPLGALPNTGGFSMEVFAVVGAAITAIGLFLRRGRKGKA